MIFSGLLAVNDRLLLAGDGKDREVMIRLALPEDADSARTLARILHTIVGFVVPRGGLEVERPIMPWLQPCQVAAGGIGASDSPTP